MTCFWNWYTRKKIGQISASEQSRQAADENTKVVDLGYESFTLGAIRRGSTAYGVRRVFLKPDDLIVVRSDGYTDGPTSPIMWTI